MWYVKCILQGLEVEVYRGVEVPLETYALLEYDADFIGGRRIPRGDIAGTWYDAERAERRHALIVDGLMSFPRSAAMREYGVHKPGGFPSAIIPAHSLSPFRTILVGCSFCYYRICGTPFDAIVVYIISGN